MDQILGAEKASGRQANGQERGFHNMRARAAKGGGGDDASNPFRTASTFSKKKHVGISVLFNSKRVIVEGATEGRLQKTGK